MWSSVIKCNHQGAREEGDASVEGEGEEGRGDGGGCVQQQDHQGEGQVRGGQGQGWSKVGFSSQLSTYYHLSIINSVLRSSCHSPIISKLKKFPFSGKRCLKIESERWRRRKREMKMIWWSSCRSSRSSSRSSRWRSTWSSCWISSSISRSKWSGLPIKISESRNTCDQQCD